MLWLQFTEKFGIYKVEDQFQGGFPIYDSNWVNSVLRNDCEMVKKGKSCLFARSTLVSQRSAHVYVHLLSVC